MSIALTVRTVYKEWTVRELPWDTCLDIFKLRNSIPGALSVTILFFMVVTLRLPGGRKCISRDDVDRHDS